MLWDFCTVFSVIFCFTLFSSKPKMEIDQNPDALHVTSRGNEELN